MSNRCNPHLSAHSVLGMMAHQGHQGPNCSAAAAEIGLGREAKESPQLANVAA